jgi:hypothetical protein
MKSDSPAEVSSRSEQAGPGTVFEPNGRCDPRCPLHKTGQGALSGARGWRDRNNEPILRFSNLELYGTGIQHWAELPPVC